MTGHRAREGHRLRVREVIGSQRDIFGTFDVEWQCEGVLPLGPERAVPCGGHCHSAMSVQLLVVGTATRAWTYRFGTLDVEWQCGWRSPVRSPP